MVINKEALINFYNIGNVLDGKNKKLNEYIRYKII